MGGVDGVTEMMSADVFLLDLLELHQSNNHAVQFSISC